MKKQKYNFSIRYPHENKRCFESETTVYIDEDGSNSISIISTNRKNNYGVYETIICKSVVEDKSETFLDEQYILGGLNESETSLRHEILYRLIINEEEINNEYEKEFNFDYIEYNNGKNIKASTCILDSGEIESKLHIDSHTGKQGEVITSMYSHEKGETKLRYNVENYELKVDGLIDLHREIHGNYKKYLKDKVKSKINDEHKEIKTIYTEDVRDKSHPEVMKEHIHFLEQKIKRLENAQKNNLKVEEGLKLVEFNFFDSGLLGTKDYTSKFETVLFEISNGERSIRLITFVDMYIGDITNKLIEYDGENRTTLDKVTIPYQAMNIEKTHHEIYNYIKNEHSNIGGYLVSKGLKSAIKNFVEIK